MTSSPSNGNTLERETTFIDFYALLGQSRRAETVQLRSRLNELYAEAQANRDHRNPERRKQYAHLLQWIPAARSVLLHEERRARYDEYSAQRAAGAHEQDFYEFLQNLLGEHEFSFAEGESIPAIRQATPAPTEAPRLLPSLDAVREATQQTVAMNAAAMDAATLDAARMEPAPVVAPQTATTQVAITQTVAPSTSRDSVSARPQRAAREQFELHPSVQRERALLLSAAIGGFTFFVLLLGLRVALGIDSSLALIVVIAAIGGGISWRIANHSLLSRIKRTS